MTDSEILQADTITVVLGGKPFRFSEPVRRVARQMLTRINRTIAMLPKGPDGRPLTNIDPKLLAPEQMLAMLPAFDDMLDFLCEFMPELARDKSASDNATEVEIGRAWSAIVQLVSRPFKAAPDQKTST
ncbi:MAG: hypothetical protein IT364_24510 [Candidatus Hydrogenedentes bacterium]|nr:hypothetical protein [Candidatus Hydrogenedentota bacterium]